MNNIHMDDRNDDDDELIGPPLHLLKPKLHVDNVEAKLSASDAGSYNPAMLRKVNFHGHSKMVSCVTLDPSGSRLLSGGHDYEVKFWDFAGMDSSFKSFRSFEPCGDYPIHSLDFSNTGDSFLVASGHAQPRLYDRDGHLIAEYSKGDTYIRDLRHTKGHVASLTTIRWNPISKGVFMTASEDSTIRIWDAETKLQQKAIIVIKPKSGTARVAVSTATYSPDGNKIATVCYDGGLRIFSAKGPYQRPSLEVFSAHSPNTCTSCIKFSSDSNMLLTRGGDDSIKLWDVRSLNIPVWSAFSLPNYHEETSCDFSPDEKLIITGTSVKKNEGRGKLVFFGRLNSTIIHEEELETSSVVSVLWHKGINQIVAGQYNGQMSILFDEQQSEKGAKLSLAKGVKQKKESDYLPIGPIITPHSLPLFQKASSNPKRQKEKARNDPVQSRRPELPVQGPGRAGKIGSNITQHIVKQMIPDRRKDEDPREALLKYAQAAEENPLWTAIYKKTQPQPVFQEGGDGDEKKATKKAFIPEAEYKQLHKRPKPEDWQ